MPVVFGPYEIPSVYVALPLVQCHLAVEGTLVVQLVKLRVRGGLFLPFTSISILKKRTDPPDCALAGVGSCFTGGASLVCRTAGRAVVA